MAGFLKSQQWLLIFLAALLVAEIGLRFTNLDRKVYWEDETITSLRCAGYTFEEMLRNKLDGRIIKLGDLQEYQQVKPGSTMADVFKTLAIEDAQHLPAYYVVTRLAMEWFGSSITLTRGVAAFLSLLVFPCLYWLCWELFKSHLVCWTAMALVAISPVQILYTQEAREYSLWAATTLFCSAALLRALRVKTLVWVTPQAEGIKASRDV